MARITEKLHIARLKKFNINIKTKYKDIDDILERNTDNSKNDDINNGIRIEKDYYQNGILLKKLYNFDPRIKYTFISKDSENKEIECPNCGNRGIVKDFLEGCEYCGTHYNIDYNNKGLGAKYHYDRTIHSNHYITITFLIDLIVCLIIFLIYIKGSSRTFNIYDICKVLIGGVITASALFYVFYMLDAVIVLLPIKIYKDKQNQKQIAFWNRMKEKNIDALTFYNNFNYELQDYYYGSLSEDDNIIDYDIIDYHSFNDSLDSNNFLNIEVCVSIRIVRLINNKITSKIEKKLFKLKKNDKKIEKLNNGVNLISCHNCGASIDVTHGECDYCHTKNNYLQEWYLS